MLVAQVQHAWLESARNHDLRSLIIRSNNDSVVLSAKRMVLPCQYFGGPMNREDLELEPRLVCRYLSS